MANRTLIAAMVGGLVLGAVARVATAQATLCGNENLIDGHIVDDSYAAEPAGNWRLLPNWIDTNGDNQLGASDVYRFPALPDPTVMKLGDYFYFAGTCPTNNFVIYRTKDFKSTEVHMLAFDWHDLNGSGQELVNGSGPLQITTASGTHEYFDLWAPHLYLDPTEPDTNDRYIYLAFSAVGDTSTATETSPPAGRRTCFLARIRKGKFLQWEGIANKLGGDGPRFADQRESQDVYWYGYYYNGGGYYDGGLKMGFARRIPSTIRFWFTGSTCTVNANQQLVSSGPAGCLPGEAAATVYGYKHACASVPWTTCMVHDPFVFFDPKLSSGSVWKRVMLYNYMVAESGAWLGQHIAAAPLMSDNRFYRTDADVISMAFGANINNPVYVRLRNTGSPCPSGQAFDWVENGRAASAVSQATAPDEFAFGAVVEGATAFYNENNDRYYILYSRNTWDSPAYQILYRMTEPDQTFLTLAQDWGDDTVEEHVLLRSTNYTAASGSSYGHCEVFDIEDHNGTKHYYIAFHAKMADGTDRRMFIKELTFNAVTGEILQLSDNMSASPSASSIRYFRIPRVLE